MVEISSLPSYSCGAMSIPSFGLSVSLRIHACLPVCGSSAKTEFSVSPKSSP